LLFLTDVICLQQNTRQTLSFKILVGNQNPKDTGRLREMGKEGEKKEEEGRAAKEKKEGNLWIDRVRRRERDCRRPCGGDKLLSLKEKKKLISCYYMTKMFFGS